MNTAVRYRPLAFGVTRAVLREGAPGTRYLQAEARLGPYAERMTDRLRHWAEAAPDRTFIARRERLPGGGTGDWIRLSYADAHRKARSIGNGGWFEYSLKVLPDTAQLLRFTYWGDEPDSGAVILIDGQPLLTQPLTKLKPGQFVDIDTPIPAAALKGKSKVTIRIQSLPDKKPARFFSSSIVKAEK